MKSLPCAFLNKSKNGCVSSASDRIAPNDSVNDGSTRSRGFCIMMRNSATAAASSTDDLSDSPRYAHTTRNSPFMITARSVEGRAPVMIAKTTSAASTSGT